MIFKVRHTIWKPAHGRTFPMKISTGRIDFEWVIGEFVWTGFDYLGEPTPYNEAWPSRSSYFGICDLAGLPKDRYYLYRSRWNTEDETLTHSSSLELGRSRGRNNACFCVHQL